MSGIEGILADTNVVITALKGDPGTWHILESSPFHISIITEIELFSFKDSLPGHGPRVKRFVDEGCLIIGLDSLVKAETIQIRRSCKLKLPDAIIAATSLVYKLPLFTSDQAFKAVKGLNVILSRPLLK